MYMCGVLCTLLCGCLALCHTEQICNTVWTVLSALLYPVPLLVLQFRQAAVALECKLLLLAYRLQHAKRADNCHC